ncbi:MAG: hypothetical protein ACR2OW_01530, partial [Methyloligellaceae bacterium]
MARFIKLFGLWALFILPIVFLTSALQAQDEQAVPKTDGTVLNAEQLEKLLDLAKDQDVRVVVISPDKNPVQNGSSEKELIETAYTGWSRFRDELGQVLVRSDSFFIDFATAFDIDPNNEQKASLLTVFISTLLLLLLGRVGEHFYQLKLT